MNRLRYRITALAAALFGMISATGTMYAQTVRKAEPIRITAEKAKEMMDTFPKYVLLDVRTPEEFADGHIRGAVLLPDYEIKQKAEEVVPDKNSIVIVYCRSGRRSAASAKVLAALGYTQIYDMGGIINWPYETEK